jgi:hypothetical protein
MTRFRFEKELGFDSGSTFIAGAAHYYFGSPLCGCVPVGGYKIGSGFFIWPSSLAVVVAVFGLMFVPSETLT